MERLYLIVNYGNCMNVCIDVCTTYGTLQIANSRICPHVTASTFYICCMLPQMMLS
jgi:hypothetical protein